jgi:tetraacyldisaccharide 4'-kinase
MQKLTSWFNQLWYSGTKISWPFAPLSWIYHLGQKIDSYFQKKKQAQGTLVPVIVVGNLTLGGSGKTPLVLAMIDFFQEQGIRVGVVTRGYKSAKLKHPYQVMKGDDAHKIGDEAALIAHKTQAPIMIHPKRQDAVDALNQTQSCEVIISDDGLQHQAMARNLEIVVIDGHRGFGNGHLFPRGPLRESIQRLNEVDLIVINGEPKPELNLILEQYRDKTFIMHLEPEKCYPLIPKTQALEPMAAFAGIGNPERFFKTLRNLGIKFKPYAFPDHHPYQSKDFDITESSIIMTEKDAIKCLNLSDKPIMVLPVRASLSNQFWQKLRQLLRLCEDV